MSDDVTARSSHGPTRELLLDRQLPRFEAQSLRTVVVAAAPEEAYRAVRSLDPDQVGQTVPFMRLMVQLRGLPARIGSRSPQPDRPAPEALSADQYRQAFLVLDEEPGVEVVLGMIGKFMTPTQLEFRRFEPQEFAGFNQPGYGKVAFNFLALPYGTSRSLLCTETRAATTDPVSARRFRTYWRVVGPFAGFIMRHWLTLAKQHAEHAKEAG